MLLKIELLENLIVQYQSNFLLIFIIQNALIYSTAIFTFN